jgi:hypothetical protein
MSSRLPFGSAVLLFIVTASSYATANEAGNSADSRITVTNIAGDVAVTMAGSAANVSPSSTVLLPARIVTGHDGTLGLAQAGTKISVSSNTDVEIPAEAVDGNLVARLVQHSGNVFYDVAPRDLGKLRVETPFLVAVIKGTQFNVAVQQDRTTISLFEGRLEIHSPDDTEVLELNAGEIAIRSLIDDSIRVIGMDDLRVADPAPRGAPAPSTEPEVASTAAFEGDALAADAALTGGGNEVTVVRGDESRVAARPPHSTVVVVESGIEATVGLGVDMENPGLRVGRGGEHPGLSIGRDGENPGLGIGRHTVDGGGSIEPPVDVVLETDLAIGAPSLEIDVDVDVAADIAGAENVDTETTLDVGDVLDVGLDVNLDLDVNVDLGTVEEIGESLTVDDGSVDLNVDVGGLDLDLKVDPLDAVDLKPQVGQREDTPRPTPRGGPGGLLGALP